MLYPPLWGSLVIKFMATVLNGSVSGSGVMGDRGGLGWVVCGLVF